ncbi:MAG: MBL fold metallo-hydrolase [Chloroflexi bacterium]|nr:MBL fold metallo-hydrolase [Chloroflexota bacterium]
MSEGNEILVTKITVGPYGENCYLLADPATGEGVLVDPGAEIEKIAAAIAGTIVTKIVITHGHFDHTGALQQARAATAAPVAAHPLDAAAIPGGIQNTVADGEEIACGHHSLRVIHTPGHTPGSICLLAGTNLIAGDTVFPGGPGKTATPAAFERIVSSIRTRIHVLSDSTMIYPGHGDSTTVRQSKEEYAIFASKPRQERPFGDVLWLSN